MTEHEAIRLAVEAGKRAEQERARTRRERAQTFAGGAIRNTSDDLDASPRRKSRQRPGTPGETS